MELGLFVASGFAWFTVSRSVVVESCLTQADVYQRTRQKERKEREREKASGRESICLQEFGVLTPTYAFT